jgi:hypothetical protein
MQAGMDPSQGQPPPPPVMTQEPNPDNIAQQINPAFLEQAADLNQSGAFDASAIASLAQQKDLRQLTQSYVPTLERALDNLGRVLLLFGVRENQIKQQLSSDVYNETEDRLRDVFKGLGETLLRITQTSDQLGTMGGRAA